MLGMVFTELMEMVETTFSFDVADEVLRKAGARGSYTSVASYPDEELIALVRALSEVTGTPEGELLRAYGRYLLRRFHRSFPAFFEGHDGAFGFLAGLETRVHTEVRKLYDSARTPYFVLHPEAEGARVLEYSSPRGLWQFAHGLLEATLEHFGHPVTTVEIDDLSGGAGTHVRFLIPVGAP
jgi:hypothetical protein